MTEECDICKDEQLVRQVVARQFRKNCYKFDFFQIQYFVEGLGIPLFGFMGLIGNVAAIIVLRFHYYDKYNHDER